MPISCATPQSMWYNARYEICTYPRHIPKAHTQGTSTPSLGGKTRLLKGRLHLRELMLSLHCSFPAYRHGSGFIVQKGGCHFLRMAATLSCMLGICQGPGQGLSGICRGSWKAKSKRAGQDMRHWEANKKGAAGSFLNRSRRAHWSRFGWDGVGRSDKEVLGFLARKMSPSTVFKQSTHLQDIAQDTPCCTGRSMLIKEAGRHVQAVHASCNTCQTWRSVGK
jgi:hypothetical protein